MSGRLVAILSHIIKIIITTPLNEIIDPIDEMTLRERRVIGIPGSLIW